MFKGIFLYKLYTHTSTLKQQRVIFERECASMQLNKDDQAIIEQALKTAAANTTDYQEIYAYEGVLEKLNSASRTNSGAQADGFRYDYDDSSDL